MAKRRMWSGSVVARSAVRYSEKSDRFRYAASILYPPFDNQQDAKRSIADQDPSELDPLRFWSRIMFNSIKTAIIAATVSTAPITVIFTSVAPIPRLFRT
jgi:hypothetical protein